MESQLTFEQFARPDLSNLSDAERDAYETCVVGDVGVREFARNTGRSPGTLSNLLRRARQKVDETDDEKWATHE